MRVIVAARGAHTLEESTRATAGVKVVAIGAENTPAIAAARSAAISAEQVASFIYAARPARVEDLYRWLRSQESRGTRWPRGHSRVSRRHESSRRSPLRGGISRDYQQQDGAARLHPCD